MILYNGILLHEVNPAVCAVYTLRGQAKNKHAISVQSCDDI